MKTLTCDKCGKEIKFGRNISSSEVVMQFQDDVIKPGGTDDRGILTVDLCDTCQRRLIQWVKDRDPQAA